MSGARSTAASQTQRKLCRWRHLPVESCTSACERARPRRREREGEGEGGGGEGKKERAGVREAEKETRREGAWAGLLRALAHLVCTRAHRQSEQQEGGGGWSNLEKLELLRHHALAIEHLNHLAHHALPHCRTGMFLEFDNQ